MSYDVDKVAIICSPMALALDPLVKPAELVLAFIINNVLVIRRGC